MVAQFAPVGSKEIQPFVQGILQVGKGCDLHTGCLFQLRNVFRPGCLFQVHGLVRTPGRQYRHREGFVRRQLLMPLQRICRIIRRADCIHIAHHDQAPGGIAFALQFRVGQFPDFPRSVLVQDTLIAEETAQLVKLFPVRGVTGDVLLRHTRGAHQAPLIVVSAQPYLGNVFITDVLPDLPGVQMAVIVNNRLFLRRFMIQLLRRFRIQQKLLVQKRFHSHFLSCTYAHHS